MQSMSFEKIKPGAEARRRLSTEINPTNCKLEVMGRSRLSGSRLSSAILNDWFDNWMQAFESQPTSYKKMTEMADVLTYCSAELKKMMDKQCQVQGRLFLSIQDRWKELHSRVYSVINEFLLNISTHSQAVIKEADRRLAQDLAIREKRSQEEREKVNKKAEHIVELTRIVRQLNVKLGNHMYFQKHLRAEMRFLEEKNFILIKENNAISEIIKNVIQDLRGRYLITR